MKGSYHESINQLTIDRLGVRFGHSLRDGRGDDRGLTVNVGDDMDDLDSAVVPDVAQDEGAFEEEDARDELEDIPHHGDEEGAVEARKDLKNGWA